MRLENNARHAAQIRQEKRAARIVLIGIGVALGILTAGTFGECGPSALKSKAQPGYEALAGYSEP